MTPATTVLLGFLCGFVVYPAGVGPNSVLCGIGRCVLPFGPFDKRQLWLSKPSDGSYDSGNLIEVIPLKSTGVDFSFANSLSCLSDALSKRAMGMHLCFSDQVVML